jgi:hypothetical protein
MSKSEENTNVIPIYAAVSPRGEIIKSSIGTFRIHAHRFAAQYKNFKVIKLAEITAQVTGVKRKDDQLDIKTQKLATELKIPQVNLDKPRRKYTRKEKIVGA